MSESVVGSLVVDATVNLSRFQNGMRSLQGSLRAAKSHFGAFQSGAAGANSGLSKLSAASAAFRRSWVGFSLGSVFGVGAGLGLTMFAKSIVGVTADFEQGMARVRALSNATANEFDRLTATARKLGETTVFTARQAGDAMQFFALAGLKTNEIVGAMPHTLNLAAAGQLEMGTAADIVAKLMRSMNVGAEDLGHAVDVLAKAFTTSNTDLVQLGEAFKYVAPIANTAGRSVEELVAPLQLLGDAGIQASMAGTSLRTIFMKLAGKEAAKPLARLGVVTKDAAGGLRPLADIIDDFNSKLEGMGEAEKTAAIFEVFGQRGGPGFAVLLERGGEALRTYERSLESAGGTAKRIADQQLDTLRGSMTLLSSAFESAKIAIGDAFGDALRELVDKITIVVRWIGQWIERNRELVETWGLFVAKILAAVAALAGIIGAVAGVNALVGAMTTLAAVAVQCGVAFMAAFGPVGLVAAIAAAIVGATSLYHVMKQINAEMQGMKDQAASDALKNVIGRKREADQAVEEAGAEQAAGSEILGKIVAGESSDYDAAEAQLRKTVDATRDAVEKLKAQRQAEFDAWEKEVAAGFIDPISGKEDPKMKARMRKAMDDRVQEIDDELVRQQFALEDAEDSFGRIQEKNASQKEEMDAKKKDHFRGLMGKIGVNTDLAEQGFAEKNKTNIIAGLGIDKAAKWIKQKQSDVKGAIESAVVKPVVDAAAGAIGAAKAAKPIDSEAAREAEKEMDAKNRVLTREGEGLGRASFVGVDQLGRQLQEQLGKREEKKEEKGIEKNTKSLLDQFNAYAEWRRKQRETNAATVA